MLSTAACDNAAIPPADAPQEVWQRISQRIERPIRGKLSSVSRYRVCPEAAATCGPLPSPTSPEFTDASMLLARLAREPILDASVLHADALARLIMRGPRSSAVLSRLEAAVALAPADPRIAADLLAVRLAYAEVSEPAEAVRGEGAKQVIAAVPEAIRLARAAPREAAVWFNYGLVFETVGLPQTAAGGWRRFLALEPEGSWADEARERLASLEANPTEVPAAPANPGELSAWANTYPLEARAHLERNLLAAWAADPESGDGLQALHRAGPLSEATARHFSDSTVDESVAALRAASPQQRRRRARAFESYFAGLKAYHEQRFTDALSAFERARAGMEDLPFRGWADYRIAVSLYGLDRFAEAGEVLERMELDPARQQVLESRRLWLLALVEGRLGRLRESVALTEGALAILVRHPDPPAIASMHANLAAPLDQLGQHDRALGHRLECLRASARLGDHRLRHVTLYEMASRLIALGEPEAALPFIEEMGRNVDVWEAGEQGPLARIETALLHASALSAAGRRAEASEPIARAIEAAAELRDANRRGRVNADIAVERADALLVDDPARALQELERALDTFEGLDYRFPLVRLHRLRGAASELLGLRSIAGEAFRAAVETHEEILARLEEPEHRVGYLANASEAFDALLRHLAVEERDIEEAFEVLEKSRDVWSFGGGGEAPALRDIQARLRDGSAQLAYRVLEEETIVWWVGPRERDLLVLPGGRRVLAAVVARHEAEMALSRLPVGQGSATAMLARHLLGPLQGRLDSVQRLTILPDALLDRVAFAAVLDVGTAAIPQLDRLKSLALLPAAGLAVDGPTHTAPGVVAIGDPAFDRDAFPFLDRLPAALREAREVAALYPGSVALLGEDAQLAPLRHELRGRNALHFAGHATFDPLQPERSGLLLAPGRGDDGILTIAEVEDFSMAGLELVVLSACRTAGGERASSQDWAEALLNAGVRGVVAARWDVEDESVRRFVLRFHQLRVVGRDDGESLLATQREFRNDPPRVWAAFSYFGTIH